MEDFLNLARRTRDRAAAFEYYLKAAQGGSDLAMVAVGNFYLEGEAVERDVDKALDWFKKAAALGNPVAVNNIGYIYEQQNKNELAIEWYGKAVECDAEDTAPLRNLAFTYAKIGESDKAAELYKQAIDRGDVEALKDLGDLYFENEVYGKAAEYYGQAAKRGNVEAMINRGQMRGDVDDTVALYDSYRWLKMALDKGHEYAPMLLGELFEWHRKYHRAIRWYKRARAAGIPEADKKIRQLSAFLRKNKNVGCKLRLDAE